MNGYHQLGVTFVIFNAFFDETAGTGCRTRTASMRDDPMIIVFDDSAAPHGVGFSLRHGRF